MKKSLRLSVILLAIIVSISLIVSVKAAPGTSAASSVNFTRDVIYQIVTDRFVDGNTVNNPTGDLHDPTHANLRKYFGGDWQGIINKITDGYLPNMGVTAIWISPPVENIFAVLPDACGSTFYHGFWARDFKRTNPFFGELTCFQNLITTAHAHDIKVIIDFAPNHTSPSRSEDVNFAENGRFYNDGVFVGGVTNDIHGYFHHFGGTDFSTLEDGIYRNLFDLADFNHLNSVIDAYFRDAIKLWLDMGVDGIRVDAVRHMPFGWQKSWMDTIYSHRPMFTFGEWFLGANQVDPDNTHFANESGMSLLDFRFTHRVRQVFSDRTHTMHGLEAMIQATNNDYHEVIDQVTFIDNHDKPRFHVVGANKRRTEQALAFLLTSRGVPVIYYGTEQYMTGTGDPSNRAMMTSFDTTTTAYRVIQELAPLRQSNLALAYGGTTQRWINNDVYIYERQFGNSVVLVAINRSETTSYDITGLFTALPAGTYADVLVGLLNGNSISVSSTGTATHFNLGIGEVGVWQFAGSAATPLIGHVGPMMGRSGQTITISGKEFGLTAGQVFFGSTAGTIVSWGNAQVKVKIPSIAAGKYDIQLRTSTNITSNIYDRFEVLSGKQVMVRFVVNNATTAWGQNVYLAGNVHELGNWDTSRAIGAMFNAVVYQYPTWYFDVSVPAGTTLEFKFIKKDGTNVIWEGGSNRVYTTPVSGTGTVIGYWQ